LNVLEPEAHHHHHHQQQQRSVPSGVIFCFTSCHFSIDCHEDSVFDAGAAKDAHMRAYHQARGAELASSLGQFGFAKPSSGLSLDEPGLR
jgi:hypothetical protein